MATVPCLFSLIFFDEWLPLLYFLLTVLRLVQFALNLRASWELFVEEGSFLGKCHFFLLFGRLHVCLGLGLLGRCSDDRLCVLRWPHDTLIGSLTLLRFSHCRWSINALGLLNLIMLNRVPLSFRRLTHALLSLQIVRLHCLLERFFLLSFP